jgi:RNA polymerase sigma-70 factor (ECF subfamily)
LNSEQLADFVQDGLMELQEDYRVVVVLRHFSDLSYRDISDVLHIPEKTVKSRLYSARQIMKTYLADRGMM